MNKIIILLLFTISIPLNAWAKENKSPKNETSKIVTEEHIEEQKVTKDQEIKNVYLNLFQTEYIVKEDLEKNKLLFKEPPGEIIINDPANTKKFENVKGVHMLTVHEKNQKKFLNNMRKTESFMRKKTDKNNNIVFTPLQFPFIEPSNFSDW